jgi:hypothetical protein
MNICIRWQGSVRAIPCDGLANLSWGPTELELRVATIADAGYVPVVKDNGTDTDEEERSLVADDDFSDADFLDEAETVALQDIYRALSTTPDIE